LHSLLEIFRRNLKYVILLNVVFLSFIFYQIFFSEYHWQGSDEKEFEIEAGKTLDEISLSLKEKDAIPSRFLFKLAVKLTGKENQIISNYYVLKNGMNNLDLIRILTDKNLIRLIRFTVPEGFTIKQIAKLSGKKLSLSPDKFLKEASNDSLINILGLKGKVKDLEGFLYPDTYDLPPKISERKLVMILFNEFRKKVIGSNKISSEVKENDSLLLRIITLASIIQGETGIRDEMTVVSGVYANRLRINMKLEADPTVQYIISDGPRRLLYEDLKIQSPYNTYLYKGLPPGPVNNPGIDAIQAALNPDVHKYLFFVATGDGGHKFSENYAQHQQAVKEYRQKIRESKNQNRNN